MPSERNCDTTNNAVSGEREGTGGEVEWRKRQVSEGATCQAASSGNSH